MFLKQIKVYTLTIGGHASGKLHRTLASIRSTVDLTLFNGAAGRRVCFYWRGWFRPLVCLVNGDRIKLR
ncbi:BZ3500_MvSof-1268-A1-R1_Chr6-3g08808 [Microbotryum saponariae]|uniref:BZ3500_MvSof-1268-A1-R1_Chr6-3g08808 protein n=1 Tax=Microbotryum saponariae TaxID=289078 RepID=A0A2X0KNT9_9BASI|nr:BZ3500_MvSof-1268-A1-R1_Chr6-3g08808 [Microbotryum saponariae]SDA07409.1 BZ3501_MvSof-1269-A2-R1_Chr6-2g08511 [Microbotryum saponariae]